MEAKVRMPRNDKALATSRKAGRKETEGFFLRSTRETYLKWLHTCGAHIYVGKTHTQNKNKQSLLVFKNHLYYTFIIV